MHIEMPEGNKRGETLVLHELVERLQQLKSDLSSLRSQITGTFTAHKTEIDNLLRWRDSLQAAFLPAANQPAQQEPTKPKETATPDRDPDQALWHAIEFDLRTIIGEQGFATLVVNSLRGVDVPGRRVVQVLARFVAINALCPNYISPLQLTLALADLRTEFETKKKNRGFAA